MKSRLICALIPVVLGACASTEPATDTLPKEEKQYQTGSNLPKRENSGPVGNVQTVDPDALGDASRRGGGRGGKGGG